jgi:aspartate/methionine/tyrosine aminotransferase
VLLATPSNPTGTSIAPDEMAASWTCGAPRGGFTLVDEIYLGLSTTPPSAAQRWRWATTCWWQQLLEVLRHDRLAPGLAGAAAGAGGAFEKLAQNLFICASSAGAARGAGLLRARVHGRVRAPPRRIPRAGATSSCRPTADVSAHGQLGPVPVRRAQVPDGAFYAWADANCARRRLEATLHRSWDFCDRST